MWLKSLKFSSESLRTTLLANTESKRKSVILFLLEGVEFYSSNVTSHLQKKLHGDLRSACKCVILPLKGIHNGRKTFDML